MNVFVSCIVLSAAWMKSGLVWSRLRRARMASVRSAHPRAVTWGEGTPAGPLGGTLEMKAVAPRNMLFGAFTIIGAILGV